MKTDVDFRKILKREFETRSRRNPSYSLRAFARDLSIPASKLSEVMRGLRAFAPATTVQVADRLRLEGAERELFIALANSKQTKSVEAKKQAIQSLASISEKESYEELSLERFRIIADWFHFAILELTEIAGFESDPSWIAGRLGISTKIAKEAIERLIDFGLLEISKTGTIKQTRINLATPNGIPSREIREHHSQILMKAEDAIHSVPLSERDFSALTLAFDPDQMSEVREELKKLRRKLGSKVQDRKEKKRVYCLAIQFFPLDKNKN